MIFLKSTLSFGDEPTTLLAVKVTAGAQHGKVGPIVPIQLYQGFSGALKIATPQIAQQGKANAAVLQALASVLNVPPSRIILKKGATSSFKILEVPLAQPEVLEALQSALGHAEPADFPT